MRRRIDSNHKFNGAIKSAAAKATNALKRKAIMHDPFADLNHEISRMTSRDPFVRSH